jgi:hypothetical protein
MIPPRAITSTSSPRSALAILISLTAAYLLLAVALTWPLASDLGAIWGSPIARADGWQKVYFFWWARYALEHHTNPLFARLLYAPHGARLELEPLMLPLSLPALPVQYAFGPVVAYNLATLATLTLNGLALYALARRFVTSRLAAFVGGALWLASPIALTVIWHGQLEKAIWFAVPLLALALLHLYEGRGTTEPGVAVARSGGRRTRLRRERLRRAVVGGPWSTVLSSWFLILGAALLLALTAFLGLYVFLFTCVFCALLTLAWALLHRRRALTILARGALVAALAAAPLLLVLGGALAGGPVGDTPDDRIWLDISRTQGADLLDLALPVALRPGRAGVWQFAGWPHTGSFQSAAGYTLLALAVVGALALRRAVLPLLGLALAMSVVGMGASLRVAGVDTGLPLPYRLIEGLPGVNVSRYPQLALFAAHMLLAVLAACGFAALARRLPAPRRLAFAALVCALILAEYGFWRVERRPIITPAAAVALAAQPGSGSVLALPYNHDVSEHLVYQMTHQKPVWGGYLARIPANYHEVEYVPILRELRRNIPDHPDVIQYSPDDRRALLRFYGAAYVLYDKAQADAAGAAAFEALWRRVSEEPPLVADERAALYAIPAPAAERPQCYLRLGWWEPQDGARWMSEAATLRLINPAASPARLVLRLQVAETAAGRLRALWQGEEREHELRAGQALAIPLTVPPGEHELRLTGIGELRELAGVPRRVTARVTRIELEPET